MLKRQSYILFIDEAGKSKFSDEGDYISLCGLIINKDLHTALSSYMISLKESSRIPATENIHAFDLFEQEKIRKGGVLTYTQINTFFERLFHLIHGVEMQYMIVSFDKTPFKSKITRKAAEKGITERQITRKLTREGVHDFLYEGLSRKLILEFAHFLESKDAYGEIMAESRRDGDVAVVKAFNDATQSDKFSIGSNYERWSKFAFNRINSLTFQNKKGLSFGLEIADLFAWSHFNNKYGKKVNPYSPTKNRRIDKKLLQIKTLMNRDVCKLKNGAEDITERKLKTLAMDRVSEFTKILNES